MTVNEIRHHMATIDKTKKITGTMEMISSNRIQQVMGHIEYNQMYFSRIRKTMKEILMSSEDVSHPYLVGRERRHHTFMVISGDKGLCGSHNTNVLEFALKRFSETPGSSLITVGHTAEEYFKARGIIPDITFIGIVQDPTLKRAREVARELTDLYEKELTDDIRVINTSFYSDTRGKPVEMRLLPVRLHDYDDIDASDSGNGMIYHPSAQTVFDMMVPQYTIGLVFGVMVKAYASEHFARMNAMREATKNAEDMLKDLHLKYNLARQSAITNEIAEITGSGMVDG